MHLLNYFRRKSESKYESEAAGGVELSVRQPRPGQELKALPQSASKTAARKTARRPDQQHDSKRKSNGLSDPLEVQGSPALPVTAAGSLAPAVLLSLLSSKQWLRQSCSSTRLVLSTLVETAAVNSTQQQHVLQQLQRVADSVSWEAACSHCMDALVIRCADLATFTLPV
jgi:isochorismate synthase EntC